MNVAGRLGHNTKDIQNKFKGTPMIKLVGFISLALILINTIFTYKKKTPILTYIFVWLVIEFFFTSFISVIVDNVEFWKVSKNAKDFIIFRVAEVIVIPLVLLFYLEVLQVKISVKLKLIYAVIWVLMLLGVESLLVNLDIIKYANWQIGWSIAVWVLFLLLVILAQLLFNKILRREGVI
jgi:hypothetical protein